MDEKGKLSKRGSRRMAAGEGSGPSFKGSTSKREGRTWRSLSSRCARLVKEQRARFYIMRRCVAMLICWRDYP